MRVDFFWLAQTVNSIALGLGIPSLIIIGITIWRKQSIEKMKLEVRSKELDIEAEKTRVLLMEHESRSLERQFSELEK